MKIQTQGSDEMRQLGELIKPITVAMLTTLNSEGHMESRPMSPLEMDDSGGIWFLLDMRSGLAEYLEVMNLAFADVAHSTFVSISGHGELHSERAVLERLWTETARPWFPDGLDSGHLAVLKFNPLSAEYWDSPNSKMVRMVALAASVAKRKPVGGMGDQAKVAVPRA